MMRLSQGAPLVSNGPESSHLPKTLFHSSCESPRQENGAAGGSGRRQSGFNFEEVFSANLKELEALLNSEKKSLSSASSLTRVVTQTDEPEEYVCGIGGCKRKFCSVPAMKIHQTRIHGPKIDRVCGLCSATFDLMVDLKKHVRLLDTFHILQNLSTESYPLIVTQQILLVSNTMALLTFTSHSLSRRFQQIAFSLICY